MTTKKSIFLGILGLSGLLSRGQNVQSNASATSGGLEAGTSASPVGQSVFYGYQAGKANTQYGQRNSFLGHRSGVLNTNGSSNTFLGSEAGVSNSTGSHNTFIGESSGNGNTIGSGNTCIGQYSGGDTAGSNNVYIGSGSGSENSGGSGNVFIGSNSGYDQIARSNTLLIANNESNNLIWGDFAQNRLKLNGKVGVGYGFGNYPTTAGSINVSAYNLFVKGGMLTEEVRVSLTGTWADYVFKKDYKLPTLQEVEKQIQEKGHLFNVPSAKQVKEDGIELGEMARIQQEKIEELTLYVIEQNKINEKQGKEIAELKAMIQSLAAKK